MRKKPHESHTLIEPQHAVRVYLDALLGEVDLVADTKPELDLVNKPVDDPALEKALRRATETINDDANKRESSITEDANKQPRISPPDWAEAPFQCLSFQVAGVTLAAPLEKLNGIVELEEEITELPGYAPWVIGLLPNRGQNVQVVDVAQIIMPNEGASVAQPTAERMKFIILLEDGKFGLAADSISQVLSLTADEVRWRGTNSKRPWLAGMITEQMCALLEVDLLCAQLQAGLKGV
jgi:purine-binding chemotaxis protein CheW